MSQSFLKVKCTVFFLCYLRWETDKHSSISALAGFKYHLSLSKNPGVLLRQVNNIEIYP